MLTSILTIAIEDIQAGVVVWSWNEETGETELKEVVETYVNETYELTHVFVDGEEIVSTPAHLFYSPVKGWTLAGDLRAGDILVTVNGEYRIVEWVQHEILEQPVRVYNFQVEGNHTYYASGLSLLVHNQCGKYYKATRGENGVEIGDEIMAKQALTRLRNGNDVFASSRKAAKKLAKKAFGNSSVYDEIHDYIPNALWHFHDDMNHFFHVFYG